MKKGNIWISIYKILVVLSFVGILFAGIMVACDAYDFFEFILMFAAFALLGGFDLAVGMLIASFFENVQIIREKIEQMN